MVGFWGITMFYFLTWVIAGWEFISNYSVYYKVTFYPFFCIQVLFLNWKNLQFSKQAVFLLTTFFFSFSWQISDLFLMVLINSPFLWPFPLYFQTELDVAFLLHKSSGKCLCWSVYPHVILSVYMLDYVCAWTYMCTHMCMYTHILT